MDVEKFLLQITRLSSISWEKMETHPLIQEQQVVVVIPSACVLVGRYIFSFLSPVAKVMFCGL